MAQGVPCPGPIEVKRQSHGPAGFTALLEQVGGLYCSASLVDGILDADQCGAGEMAVGRVHLRTDDLSRHPTAWLLNQAHTGPAVPRDAATLVIVDMTQAVADHLIAGRYVDIDGDLVCHGARWAEQSRFMTETLGQHVLQAVHRGVLCVDIIAGRCRHHGFEHGRGRPRHRIASQVNHLLHSSSPSSRLHLQTQGPFGAFGHPQVLPHREPCSRNFDAASRFNVEDAPLTDHAPGGIPNAPLPVPR